MEHIIQFGVNIDDDAIRREVVRLATREIIEDLKKECRKELGLTGSIYSRSKFVDSMVDGILADCREQVVRGAASALADLIDPGDMSQSRRDAVACDPTGRGIDSIYEWCFERLEGADGAEDELCCSIMRAIEDYRHPELATAHTVRAVDREALLAQVEELEKCAWYFGLDFDADEPLRDRLKEASEDFAGCARRIREACGERAS